MDNIDEEKLSNLINDPNLEKLELWLRIPNFFSILAASRTEIRHSNFLSWVLDPNGTHGMSDLFLRKFLREIFSDKKVSHSTQFDVDSLDLRSAEVRREWKHIDILIVHPEIIVAIENKFDSQDSKNQLKRYSDIVKETFPSHKKCYVYLTPYGTDPNDAESGEEYANYSYETLCEMLERILEIYQDSLSNRVKLYLQDYLSVLRRELMQTDELNKIAVKIYEAHRDALDFIFENRSDPASELFPYFEKKVLDSGWVLCSKNKGVIRFLTPKLDKIIPKGYSKAWPQKESFLFEINYYWNKNATFSTVISPGTSETSAINKILSQAMETVQGFMKPQGKQWLVHFREKWQFVANDIVNESSDEIKKSIDKFWPEIVEIVNKVEPAILAKKDELQKFLSENS